jgi:hypothetical protein
MGEFLLPLLQKPSQSIIILVLIQTNILLQREL